LQSRKGFAVILQVVEGKPGSFELLLELGGKLTGKMLDPGGELIKIVLDLEHGDFELLIENPFKGAADWVENVEKVQ